MLANSDDNIKEAVSTVYELSQDKYIQYKCQQREEAIRRMNTDKRLAEKYKAEKEQLLSEKKQLTSVYNQVSSENEKLTSENKKLKQLLKDHNIDPNT